MPVFTDAWRALRRNYLLAGLYIGTALVLNGLFNAFGEWMRAYVNGGTIPVWLNVLSLSVDIASAVAWGALQALVFSMLGREIDRPLWKCSGPAEALRRYFFPWFLMTLVILALMRVEGRVVQSGQMSLAILLELINLAAAMLLVPCGACIMYRRGLVWSELGETLQPIVRFAPLAAGVLLIGMLQWALRYIFALSLPESIVQLPIVIAATEVPIQLLDCLAFAAMWIICMLHRDHELSGSNDDLDF